MTQAEIKAAKAAEAKRVIETGNPVITEPIKFKIGDDKPKDKGVSLFGLRDGYDIYDGVIDHLEYMCNKDEPDNENKGIYFVYTKDDTSNIFCTVPAGFLHKKLKSNVPSLFSAIGFMEGSTIRVNFAKEGEALRSGEIVVEGKEEYYSTGIEIDFHSNMKFIATTLKAGQNLPYQIVSFDKPFSTDVVKTVKKKKPTVITE